MLHDPFTPERQLQFCAQLALSGNVRAACGRVGIGATTAYRARQRHAAFAAAWDAALALARDHAEAVLAERALEGVEEEVFHRGELIATRRKFDGRLLLAHLARLDRRCAEQGELPAGDFDELLAGILGEEEADRVAREDYVKARVKAAKREAEQYWLYGEGEWDEVGRDPILVAMDEARAEAEAEWDARRAALHARVDALVGDG